MTQPIATGDRVSMASAPPNERGLPIDRRTLIGVGAAGLALAGLSTLHSPATHSVLGQQGVRYVVTDRRYPASLAFARPLVNDGAVQLDVTQGLTSLWRDRLAPLWQQSGGQVTGLTTAGVWIVLAEQARGQFRKPRLLGRHLVDDQTGTVSHHVASVGQVPLNAASWPEWMTVQARDPLLHHQRTVQGEPPAGTLTSGSTYSLASWIIV